MMVGVGLSRPIFSTASRLGDLEGTRIMSDADVTTRHSAALAGCRLAGA
jgi:hypothetical protein